MLHYLTDPLQYTFMQRALVAVVLTGLACGVLGSYVVLRGLAFIGDALTHVGQLVMLRRMAGSPIRSSGYFAAEIVAGEITQDTFKPL